MKKILLFLFICFSFLSFSQIKGTIKDGNGNPIPFVNIYIENTYIGTTSNELGNFEITNKNLNSSTIIFQYLGYKTQKYFYDATKVPQIIEIVMLEDNYNLNEVVLNANENPANQIIRNAIANRKINSDKTSRFTADFYSRGIFRVKDVPKKIMGIDVGDMDGDIDSTRSGVIYLSETVSKIKFEKPDNLKEEIIASKVAGNDNGFSYNTALATNYDFYENYVNFNINLISPIANNAFNYYKYKLEGTFYDDNNQLINKISVIPRRDKEPVFEGFIYIVEDSWAIYGIDLDLKGYRMQQPILETLKLVQNFSFNKENKIWAKNLQSIDFNAGFFGIKFTGKFSYVFSNYEFKDAFAKKTFGNEIVSFADNANKKDDDYWKTNRGVPLTDEEIFNYNKKDSIQTLRKSEVYLDSIDNKKNKYKFFDVITGYTFTNSFKKWSVNYKGILNLSSLSFNTVQGWNLDSGFSYRNWNDEKGKYTFINSTFNYGFAEDRLRVNGSLYHRFNRINNASINISGGNSINQFNGNEPISKIVNSVSTLFFKNNFMKLYNKEFAEISYGQEVLNGLSLNGKLVYEIRKPLFNTTDYSIIKSDDAFTSNNPLAPEDFTSNPFDKHYLYKTSIGGRIRFGQKYISRPDGKINIQNNDYPTINFNYEKAFAASEKKYEYDLISATVTYEKTISNKGVFSARFNAGKFFDAENISFIDYKHFNGNQTHVNIEGNYLNSFGLLPYYSNSTNDAYLETHLEHNFKGYILNKIPLINKLQWNLIGSFHQINVPNLKPYQEFSVGIDNVGFGKFKILRINYVRAYQNGYQGDGFVFGLKFR